MPHGVLCAAASSYSGRAHYRSLHSRRRPPYWAHSLAAARVQLEAHLTRLLRLGWTSEELADGHRWDSSPAPPGSSVLRPHRCLAAWLRQLARGATRGDGSLCMRSLSARGRDHPARHPHRRCRKRQGLPTTSPVVTVFDVARRLPLVDAVAAVDAALHNRIVDLAEFRSYVAAHSRCAGVARARQVADLADASSESQMETRLR